ncbi:uncharacterized protein LOC116249965 isoform X1 [Nymphaea colorata]|nr:uncharacterized protein LOC116249965 isoform X1 [Nymphaea colorata]
MPSSLSQNPRPTNPILVDILLCSSLHPMVSSQLLPSPSPSFILPSNNLWGNCRVGGVGLAGSAYQLASGITYRNQVCRAQSRASEQPSSWLAQLPEDEVQDGPIQLPPLPSSSSSSFGDPFDTSNPSPIQVSTSVLLTGAISVFLFRSLRRRARRAKELKLRSSEAKSLKEEAIENLKAMGTTTLKEGPPPSPVQALLGGLAAGAIALILYKFTTTIEAALNQQAISDNFSVRQITITVRTIVNGLCYLATFVFAINSIGLILYSGQLTINSFMSTSTDSIPSERNNGKQMKTGTLIDTPADNAGPVATEMQKSEDDTR